MWVPRDVNGVVETVSIDWPEPPCESGTLVGFKLVVMVGSLSVRALDSPTAPEKPLLRRVMVDVPTLPAEIVKEVGDAVIEKSGAAETRGVRRNVAITSPRYTSFRIFVSALAWSCQA